MTRETRFEEEDSRIIHKLERQVELLERQREQDHKLLLLILDRLTPKFRPTSAIVVVPQQGRK
jgi:hypothetical protein